MQPGKLILLPNVLDTESDQETDLLPARLSAVMQMISGLIAEDEKEARKYLRRFLSQEKRQNFPIRLLNEHTIPKELETLLEPLQKGEIWGLISDAGLPCVADPGAHLVSLARRHNIPVQALPGPSSLILALQLSGFSGQSFCFHGYLPRELPDLERMVKDLERRAKTVTQIWIEAPYRSQKMLSNLKEWLHADTNLCVAASLNSSAERVVTQSIHKWKGGSFELGKEPTVFLLG